jgi:hypothetical protein
MVTPLSRADTHLAHGYTLRDLDRLARYIAGEPQWGTADRIEIHQIAHDGLVDAILGATDAPTAGDVCVAARAAVYAAHRAWRQSHGYRANGPGQATKFFVYWAEWAGPTNPANHTGHADLVVERLALSQILGALSPADARVITALAATSGRADTAKAIGLSPRTASRRITEARARAIALWHEGDTPPAPPRPPRDTRPPACGTRSGYGRHRARRENACKDCRDAHSAYLRAFRAARKSETSS